MSKQYGSYTDADLNDWQMLPESSRVLTSSAFGAWLLRRDERKGNRDLINELEKIKTELQNHINTFGIEFGCELTQEQRINNYAVQRDIDIIDKRISELKGENNE